MAAITPSLRAAWFYTRIIGHGSANNRILWRRSVRLTRNPSFGNPPSDLTTSWLPFLQDYFGRRSFTAVYIASLSRRPVWNILLQKAMSTGCADQWPADGSENVKITNSVQDAGPLATLTTSFIGFKPHHAICIANSQSLLCHKCPLEGNDKGGFNHRSVRPILEWVLRKGQFSSQSS